MLKACSYAGPFTFVLQVEWLWGFSVWVTEERFCWFEHLCQEPCVMNFFSLNLPFHLTSSWFTGQWLPKEMISLSQPGAPWGGRPWEQNRPLSKMEREQEWEFKFPYLSSFPQFYYHPTVSSLLVLSSPVCFTAFPKAKLTWLLNIKLSGVFITVLERAVFFSSTSLERLMFCITLLIIFFSFLFFSLSGREEGEKSVGQLFQKEHSLYLVLTHSK